MLNSIKELYIEEKLNGEGSDIKDNYHSISELYFNRLVLFSIICNTYKNNAWKSKLHSDGTMFEDYFIVGISTPQGDFTYHYNMKYWELFNVKELKYAPIYDGHQPSDIGRLYSLLGNNYMR